MAFRTSISAALLTALLMSGCMTTQKSSGLSNPFSKGDFSALTKRKKPLTQVAMDALTPKEKAPVKIVSPRDWFRGTSSATETAAQVTGEQLSNLAAQYRAAAQQAANGAAQQLAQPIANTAQAGVSPLLSFDSNGTPSTPSKVSMPSAPQNQMAQLRAAQNALAQHAPSQAVPQFPQIPHVSGTPVPNGLVAAASTPQTPQVQFQAARLPLGQPVANVQQAAAQYSTASTKKVAQAAMAQSVFPQINTRVHARPVQAPSVQAPTPLPNTPQVHASLAPQAPAYPSTTQAVSNGALGAMAYPSTPQQALPGIPTAVVPPRSSIYR